MKIGFYSAVFPEGQALKHSSTQAPQYSNLQPSITPVAGLTGGAVKG